MPYFFNHPCSRLIYGVWTCGVTGGANRGQCHAQMDCRWETWQPVAAPYLSPCHVYYIPATLPFRQDATGAICSCWMCKKWWRSRRGNGGGGLFVSGPVCLPVRGAEKRWFMNRGIIRVIMITMRKGRRLSAFSDSGVMGQLYKPKSWRKGNPKLDSWASSHLQQARG